MPPYDDVRIVAGQGTATVELLEQAPDIEQLWVPVGGGGLAAGAAVAARGIDPDVDVIAAEPSRADDAFRSLANGRIEPMRNPATIADGLRTPLGRIGGPDDVAPAFLFLAIPAARFVTGHTLVVDGGNVIQEHHGVDVYEALA